MRTGKPLTMNPELVLENSSPAAVYTLPNTIIYLKAIKCLNIRTDLELMIKARKIGDQAVLWL